MAQPFLHELVVCVRAPTCVLSATDGQVRAVGAQGLFHDDVRHLAELIVRIDGREPLPVAHRLLDHGRAIFVAALEGVGDPIPDPTVRLERTRRASARGFVEDLTVVNDGRRLVEPVVTVRAGTDMASMSAVKRGAATSLVVPVSGTRWATGGLATEMRAESADGDVVAAADADGILLRWIPQIPSRQSATLTLQIDAAATRSAGFAASTSAWVPQVEVRSRHAAIAPLLQRSLDDLGTLLLVDGSGAGDRFAAAGAPWFMTLFGRDSLWAARFALPVDGRLAAGTLRTLARRQATSVDAATAAEPGKILHEVRAEPARTDAPHALPPLYYGSVDATPLWVSLLHDAWCWGLPDAEVADLLDALVAAVGWLVGHDGFLAYQDESGRGLANQGWKDSGDSIQDAAGRIATAPITLCEVQGYAYRAALDGARLLDAFGRPGAPAARAFAADLRARFRSAFWTSGPHGRFPAVALDGDRRAVDSLTSNIGHLPATGILDADEITVVAGHLGDSSLDSGYGLRTLADDHPMFNPLGYHSGSVWPHDTAIAIDGLAATGHGDVAAKLARGLVAASEHFGFRLPELFGGWPATSGPPLDYPAACRPQAWAAACPVVILRAALGLRVDVPAEQIVVRPDPAFAAMFPMTVKGLRIGSYRLDVAVDADGTVTVDTDAPYAVTTP